MTRHKFRLFWGLNNFFRLYKLNFKYEGLEQHKIPTTCFTFRKNVGLWVRADTDLYTLG